MNSKNYIAILLLCFIYNNSFAQVKTDSIKPQNLKHNIGVAFGGTIGEGLSYRFMHKKIGIQATFGPMSSQYETNITSGIMFLYRIIEAEKTSLFLYQANKWKYNKSESHYYYNPSTPSAKYYTSTSYFNNGFGFGFEIVALKRICINLMAGYAANNNFYHRKSNYPNSNNGSSDVDSYFRITGEAALFYRF